MYYTKKIREKKVKELKGSKAFIEYAQGKYEIYKRVSNLDGYDTFEKYLEAEVFDLYENFTMLELLKQVDRKTVNRAMDMTLKGI